MSMKNVLHYTVGDGDVVMDGDQPRYCDKNYINLPLHKSARQFFWFDRFFKDIKCSFLDAWDDLREPLTEFVLVVLIILLMIPFTPILPWLIAWGQKRRAIKRCQKRGDLLKYKGQPEA